MQQLISNVLSGLSYGSVYALLAVGLVLAYKTSGIFNLAYGAQAFVSGAVYYDTRVRHHWPIPFAFVLAVLVVAPLLGIFLDRVLFRHLRTASAVAKLVTVLGLLVAIPQILKLWFGQNPQYGTAGIVPNGDHTYNPFGTVFVNRDDLATIGVTLLAVVGLTLLFRYTAIGLRMRAVVESPRMTELAGIDAERVSMVSWILCSILAGLAGVLLAPLFAAVAELNYTTLVVVALSAAVLASLTNIPVAFAGGLMLGVLGEVIDAYLPTNSVLASNLRPALPFIVLFLVLILSPSLRNWRQAVDPLAGVDPPPPPLAASLRSPFLTNATRAFGTIVAIILGYYLFFHADDNWVTIAIQATILATIFLSITVITGMAGEISLSVATFAGIGACATAQLATRFGVAVMLAMIIGAFIAAAIGALLAIPALRLGGIFLSLATFAFALFFENVMVKFDWVGGGALPEQAPRPTFGPIDFDRSDRSFLLLCLVVLVIVSLIVIAVREGTTGRVLDALRGSEVASSAIGISATRARIVVFALSAGIAAVGGGMMAMNEKAANFTPDFVSFQGLVFVVLVVSLGSRTVEGAIQAAIGYAAFQIVVLNQAVPWIVNRVQPWYHMGQPPQSLAIILLSIGAFTYAKHPEGVLEFQKRQSLDMVQRAIDRFKGRDKADGALAGPSDPPRTTRARPGASLVSLLVAEEVTKTFAGITALDGVSLDVGEREIVGLIGPNGAGKTTLFNCMLGMSRLDGGRVTFEGRDLAHVPTHRRAKLGIARTFQRIELFSGMSPREHFLVTERVRNGRGALWKDVLFMGRPNRAEQESATAMLELLGLMAVADRKVESLSLGVSRLVEIGRALMIRPKLLLLDEPSSGLDREETAALAEKLRVVQREQGVAILLVEHDVAFVRELVERVFVLDFGTLIASGSTEDVFGDDAVRKAYLGDMV